MNGRRSPRLDRRGCRRRGNSAGPRLVVVGALALLVGCAGSGGAPPSVPSAGASGPASVTTSASTARSHMGSGSSSASPASSRPTVAGTRPSGSGSRPSGSGPASSTTPPASQLAAHLGVIAGAAVAAFGGSAGVAVAAPFSAPVAAGGFTNGPAWSTAKVPVAIAALADHPGDQRLLGLASAAIRLSDNASAEGLWASLGEPQAAGSRTQAVVRELGDRHTVVQWQRIRPPFTAFGQTQWALADQAVAAAGLPCAGSAAPVLDLMGRIDPSQAFGLGHLPGVQFKGGWGPDPSGRYLTRQLGVLDSGRGHVGVALAAQPAAGSFEAGQGALSLMAERLAGRLDLLPAAECPR